MKAEYSALIALQNSAGWPVLQSLWALQHRKIVDAARKAGKQGKESAWRWYAGQLEGFEVAITQLDRALEDMRREDENVEASQEAQEQVDELLRKIKGEK